MNFEAADFQRDVLDRSRTVPVVVDFWAEWCGPCKVLGPILEKLAASAEGRWELVKVDTEKYQDIAIRYNIASIPNVKLFVDGEVVDEFVGALPEYAVAEWLDRAVPGKSGPQLAEAAQLLAQGHADEAAALLEEVVSSDAGNAEAKVLLGRLIVFSDPVRAASLCRDVAKGTRFSDEANLVLECAELLAKTANPAALADSPVKNGYLDAIRSFSQQDFAAALDQMIRVLARDRTYDTEGPRKACITMFHWLGEENELTKHYRRIFGMALNG
jgi:putative thioredoxin